jgi:hypothetical protein
MKSLSCQRGSALVEAAIIFPCLMLIVMWAAAVTDIMVLKLKSSEAARFSLWESTVFRTPQQIDADMQARFVDLRSPLAINTSYTGLMMYPLASNIQWKATVDTTSAKVSMGPPTKPPPTNNPIQNFIALIIGAVGKTVDAEMARERFNVNGKATARVTLVHATHDERASSILKGGDLLGLKGGNDIDHSKLMTNFTFQTPLPSEKPMQLVFDTWKAWPKPAQYTTDGGPVNVAVAPAQTYPTVEKAVSAQVNKIAFFGLTRQPWFNSVNNIVNTITGSGISQALLGGKLPDIFSTDLMDGPNKGPITILPPEKADASYVPSQCTAGPCATQRIGDVTSSGSGPQYLDKFETMGDHVDRTRYTIPYRINTVYWRSSGGTNYSDAMSSSLINPQNKLTQQNEYVKTYQCRGHYFAGSTRAQETDRSRRYLASCNR